METKHVKVEVTDPTTPGLFGLAFYVLAGKYVVPKAFRQKYHPPGKGVPVVKKQPFRTERQN